MALLIAGECGAVLAAAENLGSDGPRLAIEGLAGPMRINGFQASSSDGLDPSGVDSVVIADAEVRTVDAVTAWAHGHGLVVRRHETVKLVATSGTRVVAVSSPSTGSGKSALTRKVARSLRRSGVRVIVARNPIAGAMSWPGGQDLRMLGKPEDLDASGLHEREELAPVIGAGVAVVVGSSPAAILKLASDHADVIVWDGGGAAMPWVEPDLHLVIVDCLRAPVEANRAHIQSAHNVVLAKADTAGEQRAQRWEQAVSEWNPEAKITVVDMPIGVPEGPRLRATNVVIVEDWSSMAIGGLKAGGGAVVARRYRCAVTDPRPFAVGEIAHLLAADSNIGPVIPALGRTEQEVADLAASVKATPAEVVLWAPAADFAGIVDEDRPVLRLYPEIMEVAGTGLQEVLRPIIRA